MSLRFVSTPLPASLAVPEPRPDGFRADVAEAFCPSPALEAGLARLRLPGAVAVTSGQQPGLFTGPLYTMYKALSTGALARRLESRWKRPVVPVFWLAGDDHDYAEANVASWIGADGNLATASLPPRSTDAPLTPMYRQPLGDGVLSALQALAGGIPPSEFREPTLEWLGRHYRPEQTVAGSFAGAMAELLAPHGILCFDSTHPAAKRAAAPVLLQALALSAELDSDLDRYYEALGADARTSGVTVGDGASLVMLEASQGRDRLIRDGTGFVARRSRERFSLSALESIAATEPTRLSPNVLLRPVVESALLPTVTYLAGPAELRYLALTPPVYQRLGVHRQKPLPRWSGLLAEPRVDRVLDKFGITLEELAAQPGALEARLIRSQLPREALEALEALRSALESGYRSLGAVAVEIDPTMERPIQGARQQALSGTHEVERKLVQHLKRRQETEFSQLARARTAVLPGGKPQERVLTIAPFLARHGPALLGSLSSTIEQWYDGGLEGPSQPS
jgi:bacillithiol biosynthesis cysteine-adding enzyme BshC